MKKKQLIAKLVKSGLVMLALLVVTGGAYMYISLYKDELVTNVLVLEKDTKTKASELTRLERELSDSQEAAEFYKEFQKKPGSKEENFRKNSIRDILTDIKRDLSLNSLLFTVDSFRQVEGEKFRRDNAVAISAKVRIQYTAIDDVFVQRLVDEMERRFPGYIYYTKFSIERLARVDNNALLSISRGKIPDLVKGEIEFQWNGIKELNKDEVAEDEYDL